MRRPMLGIVFCYLAGICSGVWQTGLDFSTGFILAIFALVFAFLLSAAGGHFRARNRMFALAANVFIFLAVFFAGWLAVDLRLHSPSARDLSALMDKPREGIELIGIVADDPALRKNRLDEKKYWSFGMRVEAVSRVGMFQKARGEVQVRLSQNEIQPCYGERWHLRGVLVDNYRFPDLPLTEAGKRFIPQRFLFYVDSQSVPVLLTQASRRSWLYWCFFIREKCSVALSRGIEHRPDVIAILQALVLGRQHELTLAMREAFVATGTYHIFAISGQHVAIIALFIVFVLQLYGVGRLNWFYYLAPVLIVFTVMTGMSASAVRGCIMALMCFLGPLFKRKTDISSAMALAALLIVGVDPLQLFQAGFILSFGIVAGLIVLCPPLIAMVIKRIASDPYRLEPENLPARTARKIIQWVFFMLTASFAAWLVSTPLIARWFNLVSPVALLANLLVIPLATLVLLAGCLSIVFGWCWPFITEAFNFTNVFLVSLMVGLTEIMARIPFGHIFVRSPPLWFVCLWLAVLVIWRSYYQKTRIWLAAVLVMVIAGGLMWYAQRNEWEIHVFNIDQCAVCLVNKAGNKPLLLNAGSRYQAHSVLRYLHKMGVNRIQAFLCPFPDAKHIGAAKEIIAAVPVSRIWCGAKKPGAGSLKELCAEAEKRRIGAGELTNGITPGDGQSWRIRSGRNGWNIDVFNGSNGVIQDKREDLSRLKRDLPDGRSDGPLTIFINTNVQTQMTARILIGNEQTPLAVDIEESPISGSGNGAGFAVPTEAQCRILCCPTRVERAQSYCGQSSGLQLPARIILGPGQGVLLLPGKEKEKARAINLDLSAGGR